MRPIFRAALKGALLTTTVIGFSAGAYAQPSEVEEIVVEGIFIPDEKRATSEISNVLDEEALARTGDSDIAVTLQRVTGLSLVRGKFVFVRGLGERYSSALLDGSALPSPEPLRRVVPLDVFPNALLGGALVQKTYSPQFPAEFGGGLIEVRTKAVPDEQFAEFGVSLGYNTASTGKTGLSYYGGGLDILGIDDGTRNRPQALIDNPLLENISDAENAAIAEEIANRWTIDAEKNAPDIGLDFVYGDRFDGDEQSLGIIFAANYDSGFTNKFGERNTFVSTAQGITTNDRISPEVCDNPEFDGGGEDCGLRSTEWEIALNGLFSAGLEIDSDNTVKFTSLILRKSTREATIEKGEFAADPGTLRTESRIDWVSQQLWTNQLSGEHYLDLFSGDVFDNTQINWRALYATAERNTPLRRTTRYEFDDVLGQFELLTRTDANRTDWGQLKDNIYDVGLDIVQPSTIGDYQIDWKGGIGYQDKDRVSDVQRYAFLIPGAVNRDLLQLVPEIIFGPANIGPGQILLGEFIDNTDQFEAGLELFHLYGQFDAQLTDTIRLAAGFRYEDSEQTSDTIDRATDERVFITQKGEYLLPAITATWEFYDNMQFRLAYSQTLSRPDLRELSSATFLDPDRDRPIRGNPELTITEITNYDARWEWYFGPGQFATIGVFYKEFTNPIERTFGILGEGPLRSFVNNPSAELLGVEAEIEYILPINDWLGDSWRSAEFYVKANAAFIDSEITIDQDATQAQQTDTVRRLQGQSDVLANFQIGFDDFETGEKANLLLNFTGDRIDDVGLFGVPNVVEKPPILLDFNYSRRLEVFSGDFEVSFKAQNILNDDFLLTVGDEVFEQYEIGRSFSLGVKTFF